MNLRTLPVIFPKKKSNSKEYKFMTLLLKTLQILFGLDLGFFEHKSLKFRLILKLTSFIHCFAFGMIVILEICDSQFDFYNNWTPFYFLEYLLTIILLTFFKRGTTFMNLQESLDEIDVELQQEVSRNHVELKLIMTIFFIYIERMFVAVINCSMAHCCSLKLREIYLFVFLNGSVNVPLSCYSFMLYSLYLRLAKLSSLLKSHDDNGSVQNLYKTIIDTVEKYKSAFDSVYVLRLLCNIPEVMVSIYFTLQAFQNRDDVVIFVLMGARYLYILEVLSLIIAPGLMAEMLTGQAEKIKTILHEKELVQDMQNMGSLTRFIRYVEARPCRFRVWKLIPLSADLLSMVLSFCVTYLIVIIQFTNLKPTL